MSAHFLASMAGAEILLQGGNAMDAAIATAAALNVVEFYRSGLGGVGVMVVSSSRKGERAVLDFTGLTPHASSLEDATPQALQFGPKAILTPGALSGWLAALERFGTMPRDAVFEPAIRLAATGFPLTARTCEFLQLGLPQLAGSEEGRRIVLERGTLRPGRIYTQPEMAQTLREIVEGGAAVMVGGRLGQAITKGVRELGGWLDESDLAAARPTWQDPTVGGFGDVELIVPPPPASSWQVLETLHILGGFELRKLGHNTANYLHLFIEAAKLAASDRLAYARSTEVPVRALVSESYAAAQRSRLDRFHATISGGERFNPQRAPGELSPGAPRAFSEETTHFATADNEMVVSVTASLGNMFGSGVVVPGTGIFLNNFLAWTDLDPRSPNYLRGGEQIELMLTPVQGFRDGLFVMSIGTPGSFGILQTTPQMILNHLVFGMNIQEAIEMPRICTRTGKQVDVESRIPESVRDVLRAMGHEINVLDDHGGWAWPLGGGHGISRDPESGALSGGADPRREGYAIAV